MSAYASSEQFLAHFHPGTGACLMLDLELPGKSGIELMEILGQHQQHLPVIVVTGKAGDGVRTRALDLGAAAVLVKPTDPDLLIETIRRPVR